MYLQANSRRCQHCMNHDCNDKNVVEYLFMSNMSYLPFQERMTFEKRLVQASTKNIKIAILLSKGPVATHLTTRNMSTNFQVAIKKANYTFAATQLESSGLGNLVVLKSISNSTHVFVKKTPAEIAPILQAPENAWLCSLEEYEERYNMPPPSFINERMKEVLIGKGLVRPEDFKRKGQPHWSSYSSTVN